MTADTECVSSVGVNCGIAVYFLAPPPPPLPPPRSVNFRGRNYLSPCTSMVSFISSVTREESKSLFCRAVAGWRITVHRLLHLLVFHKKDERTKKENYRPISILPIISKIIERNMSEQISKFIDKNLSPYLSGFRKGYNTQHCLLLMIEKWKKALDNKKHAGAILTDLFKSFWLH